MGRNYRHQYYKVVDRILASKAIEEQSYLTCRSLLKLSDTYSPERLEEACSKALKFSQSPSYKVVKDFLVAMKAQEDKQSGNSSSDDGSAARNPFGITRGARYYGGDDHAE